MLLAFLPIISFCLLCWCGFYFGKRISLKWLQFLTRAISLGLLAIGSMVGALMIFGEFACRVRVPPIYSPDRKHVALLRYGLQGALGLDMAQVLVRPRWGLIAETAYNGPGSWAIHGDHANDPEVQWIDNSHLLVRYYDYGYGKGSGYEQTCRAEAGGVEVKCMIVPHVGAMP